MTDSASAVSPARLDIRTIEGSGGIPVVFTHGWANERSVWDGVMDSLGGTHPSVAWSMRGHGESEVTPPGTYTREHALADFDAVLDQAVAAAGGPVALAGHSLGGYLSLAQALRRPNDVAALILVAAGPGFRKPEAREAWNDNVIAQAAKLGVPEGSEVISMHFDSWVMDEIATITQPTLVVLGERDKAFMASAGVFEKNLDVRSTVIVPDAGHSVHAKAPTAVAQAITDFLAGL